MEDWAWEALLKPENQAFIRENLYQDPHQLVLANLSIPLPMRRLLVSQIQALQKIKHKVPDWFALSGIIWPPLLSLEQASSSLTAAFKAQLIAGAQTCVDLTGGLGVDCSYLARQSKEMVYVEQQAELAQIFAHNAQVLGLSQVSILQTNAEAYLRQLYTTVDWIYVDPARRNETQQKVFLLEDCQPNLVEILPWALPKANHWLVKTSPLLDLHWAKQHLPRLTNIWVVSVGQEVKELLFQLDSQSALGDVEVAAVDLHPTREAVTFRTSFAAEEAASVGYAPPQQYLIEPWAGIMKTGAFKAFGQMYGLDKLHPHTHLYTCATLPVGWEQLPARVFEIQQVANLDKKSVLSSLPEKAASVVVRNAPVESAKLRQQWGIRESDVYFVFAAKLHTEKNAALICRRLKPTIAPKNSE